MSENDHKSSTEFEQTVAGIFTAAGYEVSQSAGTQPGEVDWFARPKTGLERPTTYWKAWDACPAALDDALLALEETRKAKGVDRALAVMNGKLPAGHRADLQGRLSNAITARRLLIELLGFADKVRAQKVRYEAEKAPTQFLPRRGRTSSGEVVDAVTFIKSWLRRGEGDRLEIVARPYSGRVTLIERVAYELSLDFLKDPENADFLLLKNAFSSSRFEASTPNFSDGSMRTIRASDIGSDATSKLESALELLDPMDQDIESWFQAQSLAPEVLDQFHSARREVAAFKVLSNAISNLSPLLTSIRGSLLQTSKAANEWTVGVVSDYIEALLSLRFDDMHSLPMRTSVPRQLLESVGTLEDAAFQQFALGKTAPSHSIADVSLNKSLDAALSTWLVRGASAYVMVNGNEERQLLIDGFANDLACDYFVARKVANEIAAGNSAILARYQFPKDYVLLFLATLSPSAAAQATAERGAEIRAEIEIEVERRLQLTLAHLLKRSVGAIRLNVGLIQDGISPADAASFHQEFSRIEEELSLQSALAEQTGRWQEVPNGTPEGLELQAIVGAAAGPIQKKYPAVVCEIEVPALLRVRASRVGLREILHCLIENAFHAVAFVTDPEPHINIRAESEGDTVRLEILDNGPGIRPEDRERIFEPYVTTKKDVGRPFGTGLGLAIARRYAAKIGAHVALDADRPETCFVVRFVTWREPS